MSRSCKITIIYRTDHFSFNPWTALHYIFEVPHTTVIQKRSMHESSSNKCKRCIGKINSCLVTLSPSCSVLVMGPVFVCISSDILKKFNPSLKGFSRGQGTLQKGFNMAAPGAKAVYVHISFCSPTWVNHIIFSLTTYDCLCCITETFQYKHKHSSRPWGKIRLDFCKTEELLELSLQMCLTLIMSPSFIVMFCTHATQEVNFEKDWKLVTIFIGENDLCNYCIDQVSILTIQYECCI